LAHQTCKTRRPYNLYCVSADVKPCSINQHVSGARQHVLSALYAIARPSVCLSHGWISQKKRLKLGLWIFTLR